MQNNFRYKTGAVPTQVIILLAMSVPAIALFYFYNTLKTQGWNMELLQWAALLLYIPLILHFIHQILIRLNYRFQIDENIIRVRKPFRIQSFNIENISGFRIEKTQSGYDSKLYFYAKDKSTRLLGVDLNALENRSLFLDVISGLFSNLTFSEEKQNLTARELEELEAFTVHDNRSSVKEKKKEIQQMKNFHLVTLILAILMLVLPILEVFPYAAIAFPVILIGYMQMNPGKLRLFRSPGGLYPGIGLTLLFSSAAVFLHGILHYQIVFSSIFWMVFAALSALLPLLFIASSPEFRKKQLTILGTGFTIALLIMYSYGLTAVINCEIDFGNPRKLHVLIEKAEWSGNDNDSPEITVEPFGPYPSTQTIEVHKNLYRTVKKGEKIWIHLHDGLLQSPWYHKKEMLR